MPSRKLPQLVPLLHEPHDGGYEIEVFWNDGTSSRFIGVRLTADLIAAGLESAAGEIRRVLAVAEAPEETP